jgi:hypothetical protein
VSTAHLRCRSSLSRLDVVGCGQEVTEQVKKTTSVPKTKKKDGLPLKLLDDLKIPTARRKPRRRHHSHKPLNVAAEMGLKPERPYYTRRRRHHLMPPLQTLTLQTENETHKTGGGVLPPMRVAIHRTPMA